jgi:hypothetical protein
MINNNKLMIAKKTGIIIPCSPEKRITTLINYLALELFNYPSMRRILKEKYYKKLLISTYPTNQGSHHMGIYNLFFPIKTIKDKPVMFLKK